MTYTTPVFERLNMHPRTYLEGGPHDGAEVSQLPGGFLYPLCFCLTGEQNSTLGEYRNLHWYEFDPVEHGSRCVYRHVERVRDEEVTMRFYEAQKGDRYCGEEEVEHEG